MYRSTIITWLEPSFPANPPVRVVRILTADLVMRLSRQLDSDAHKLRKTSHVRGNDPTFVARHAINLIPPWLRVVHAVCGQQLKPVRLQWAPESIQRSMPCGESRKTQELVVGVPQALGELQNFFTNQRSRIRC